MMVVGWMLLCSRHGQTVLELGMEDIRRGRNVRQNIFVCHREEQSAASSTTNNCLHSCLPSREQINSSHVPQSSTLPYL